MVHDQKKLDALIDKIRKLKAKAEDPSVTEQESLAFTAKVAEMLAEYGLAESQLDTKDQEELSHEENMEKLWNASPARRVLVNAICQLYMVHTLRYTSGYKKGTWVLIGKPHNLIMVKEMSEYLIKTVLRLGRDYKKANPLSNEVDFKRGCFMRIAERIVALRLEQETEKPIWKGAGNPGNLPALYANERQLAKDYVRRFYPGSRPGRGTNVKQGFDAAAGRRAGDSVSLNRQVSGGKSHYHLPGK